VVATTPSFYSTTTNYFDHGTIRDEKLCAQIFLKVVVLRELFVKFEGFGGEPQLSNKLSETGKAPGS